MARCEQGYLCDVCGEEVSSITESSLYLSFVLGEITARQLLSSPERHIVCNPVQAQFIVDDSFTPIGLDGPFDKRNLDPEQIREQEESITKAWRRLAQLPGSGIPIAEYPLPEFRREKTA